MVNLPTKLEVSTFSRYGDMKCVKMHKIWVVWGGYGSPVGEFRQITRCISKMVQDRRMGCIRDEYM